MLRTAFICTVLAVLSMCLATPAQDDRPVAWIDGEPFTIDDLEQRIADLPPQYQSMLTDEEGRRGFLDQIIQEQVLYLAALDEDLDSDPKVERQIEQARVRSLAIAYYEDFFGEFYGYSEETLRKYYDSHRDEFMTDAQVRLRHILYATEEDALAGKARLAAGEISFSDLAKADTTDVKTRRLGGMLGLVTKDMPIPQLGAVPELQAVIFGLPVGEVAGPVQSKLGWHLLLVEENIESKALDFDRVKSRIADYILVPEADAINFYEEHKGEYLDEEQVQLRIIVCAEEDKIKAAHQALERGESFERVVGEYSEDESSAPDGGLLGYLKPSSPILALGRKSRMVINHAIKELLDGQYSEPLAIDSGWVIAQRVSHLEPRQKPYEEVRGAVRGRIISEASNQRVQDFFTELREQYDVVVNEENLFAEPKPKESPTELYALAEAAPPPTAVSYYKKILEFYPDSDEAPKAQFMIGFLYSDKLKNYDEAEAAFNAYLERWPRGDLSESARYMLEHMRDEDIELPEGL
ncbi:MAG TPA: peptidyl-prolyl cis-trans isomerase [bacterium]|nr:peptidyl-prolyl cis-trans isomerase [bacterium]